MIKKGLLTLLFLGGTLMPLAMPKDVKQPKQTALLNRSAEKLSIKDCAKDLVGSDVKKAHPLKNLDEQEDFLYVEYETGGYAVFYKDTMEMLEYSPTGSIESLEENDYYCGPKSFFKNEKNTMKSVVDKDIRIKKDKDAMSKAKAIRQSLSKKSKKRLVADGKYKYEATGDSKHTLDTSNPIKLDYGTRIPNHTYFEITPLHGSNTTGTCGAVAAEMLLTYHNYYSDRRIIPNNYLNGDSSLNKELNPNYCDDPMRMTSSTLGARGIKEDGTDDSNSYFAKIVKKIPASAMYSTVTSGIRSILNERNDVLTDDINYTLSDKYGGWFFGSLKVDTTAVKNEIDNGNPSIVLMQKSLGGANHFVVAYGYQQYTYPGTSDTYDGFITNFGWGYDDTNIWINSEWICAYTIMSINHEHSYTENGVVTGTNRARFKCSVCGHRTDAAILDSSSYQHRCTERFVSFPLNKDLYTRFNDDNYLLKRDYYKYFFFKPTKSGNRLIQTFCFKSTTIKVLSSDKKTVLASSSSGGYYQNAFLNYNFESNKSYYILVYLFPLRDEGNIKLTITPIQTTYSSFNSITNIQGTNVTRNISLNGYGVCVFRFTPSEQGVYTLKLNGSVDTVLYFFSVSDGANKALFDDDSAGYLQPKITTNNLASGSNWFIVASLFNPNGQSANSMDLIIEKL